MVDVVDAAASLTATVGEGFATIVDTRLPVQPFTAGETIFPRIIIRNTGLATDQFFWSLVDETAGVILFQEDAIVLAVGQDHGIVFEIIVPGPEGTHNWRWSAGHVQGSTNIVDSSILEPVQIRRSEGHLRFDAVTPTVTFSKTPPFQIGEIIQVGIQVINDGIGDNCFARVLDAGAVIGRVDAFVGAQLDVGRVPLSIPVTVVGPVGNHTWTIEIGHLE